MLEMAFATLYMGTTLLLVTMLLAPAVSMVVVTLLCFLTDGIGWFQRRRFLR